MYLHTDPSLQTLIVPVLIAKESVGKVKLVFIFIFLGGGGGELLDKSRPPILTDQITALNKLGCLIQIKLNLQVLSTQTIIQLLL